MQRNPASEQSTLESSLEKLGSGLRLNKAAESDGLANGNDTSSAVSVDLSSLRNNSITTQLQDGMKAEIGLYLQHRGLDEISLFLGSMENEAKF